MKFSEQVVLGSTLIHFTPELFLEEGCGCLIGMAGASLGEKSLQRGDRSLRRIADLWPWLEEPRVAKCPVCGQTYRDYTTSLSCVAVHVDQGDWTFDQALEYIRSIEPSEEADTPDTVVPVWNRYHGVKA